MVTIDTWGVTVDWNVNASVLAVDVWHTLAAVTEILPEFAVPISTVMLAVPAPEVIEAPEGSVQL